MRRSNIATLGYLLVVFASGAVVGGFANRLYMAKTVSPTVNAPPSRADLSKRYTQDMRSRLHLTDAQVAELQQIMDAPVGRCTRCTKPSRMSIFRSNGHFGR